MRIRTLFVFAPFLLGITVLVAPGHAEQMLLRMEGVLLEKGYSSLTLEVAGMGAALQFPIHFELRELAGNVGDTVKVVCDADSVAEGRYVVAYLVRRITGTVVYSRRNLQEDFHVVHADGIARGDVIARWANADAQSIGDPSDWVGRKVDWEVWLTYKPWAVADEYAHDIRKGPFAGLIQQR